MLLVTRWRVLGLVALLAIATCLQPKLAQVVLLWPTRRSITVAVAIWAEAAALIWAKPSATIWTKALSAVWAASTALVITTTAAIRASCIPVSLGSLFLTASVGIPARVVPIAKRAAVLRPWAHIGVALASTQGADVVVICEAILILVARFEALTAIIPPRITLRALALATIPTLCTNHLVWGLATGAF